MNIEIAYDIPEAEQFAQWLREQGHTVKIGHSTGNYIDGQLASIDDLWAAYCNS